LVTDTMAACADIIVAASSSTAIAKIVARLIVAV